MRMIPKSGHRFSDKTMREEKRRMNASTKGSHGAGLKWVGRAIRRLEDPALVTGQGHFTADLAATHWVRFVRSPNAAGTIDSIKAPDGAMIVTAADLTAVKKITPMLHKFSYKPVAQSILADGAAVSYTHLTLPTKRIV